VDEINERLIKGKERIAEAGRGKPRTTVPTTDFRDSALRIRYS
jgi:hypothetical protein